MIAICLHLSVAYLGVGRGERLKRRACQKFERVYAVGAREFVTRAVIGCVSERRTATLIADVNGIRQPSFVYNKLAN